MMRDRERAAFVVAVFLIGIVERLEKSLLLVRSVLIGLRLGQIGNVAVGHDWPPRLALQFQASRFGIFERSGQSPNGLEDERAGGANSGYAMITRPQPVSDRGGRQRLRNIPNAITLLRLSL